MRNGWRHGLGRIAALLGVLGLLLSGAAPAMAHAPLAETAVTAATAHKEHHHTPASPVHALAGALDSTGQDRSAADCPQHDARACCNLAGCPSALALVGEPPRAGAWLSPADAYPRIEARVPAGLAALPLTPPPRRTT